MEEVKPKPPTEYYFDVLNGQELLGGVALEVHIEAGGHPADVHPLADVSDPDFELPDLEYERLQDKWDRSDYINFTKWLADIALKSRVPTRNQKTINEKYFYRARVLGLAASFNRSPGTVFERMFGTFRNLYTEAEIPGTHRIHDFNDITFEQAVVMVGELGEALGHAPKFREIEREYRRTGKIPSPHMFLKHFSEDGKSGYIRVVEAAGYKLVWDANDALEWGSDFMEQHIRVPKEEDINDASRDKTGPGRRICRKLFGSIPAFQQALLETRGIGSYLILMKSDLDKIEAELDLRESELKSDLERMDSEIDEIEAGLNLRESELKKKEAMLKERLSKLEEERRKQIKKMIGKILAGDQDEALLLEIGGEIQGALDSGEVPTRLFMGAKTPKTIMKRFGRYQILTELLPALSADERINLSIIEIKVPEIARRMRLQGKTIAPRTLKTMLPFFE